MSADELTRTLASLADLRDRGAISPEEYEAQEGGPARPAVSAAVSVGRGTAPLRYARPVRGSRVRRTLIPSLIVVAIMLLVGFPVHEFSHALAAYRLGDGTAKLFGRLTLNPIAHFDPLGGILLASRSSARGRLRLRLGQADAGQPANLRAAARGEAIVAAAGPISNLVLAVAAALPLRFILATGAGDPGPGRSSSQVLLTLRLDQPRADGLQPVPDPAARRLEGAVRLPAAADRLAVPAGPRAVRVHPPVARRSSCRPATRSAGGSSARSSMAFYQLPGGLLRSASSARTSGPAWRRRSARDWRPG